MMRKLALLASVAAAMAFARPALAQGPFADVPTDHWAYDAVNELASRGIFTGYPDGTFGGKRALTRYEFAVAIQRMLQDVQRRIDQAVSGIPKGQQGLTREEAQSMIDERLRNVPTREEVDRLRSDVDQLRRLMTEFQDTLAALGTDVDQLKRDVAALGDRLRALEEEVHRMPKITGSAMLGAYGSYLSTGSLRRATAVGATGAATDIDNRPIRSDNVLQNAKTIYDIDLGITARLSDVATARLLLNAGNYIGGYLNNRMTQVTEPGNAQSTPGFESVRPYLLYIETPISVGSLGASITIGKFGQQFTPYTLKMVDVDSYFNNPKTDSGDYLVTGGRVNFKIAGVSIQAYAGQHNTVYDSLTSTAGSLFAGRLGDRLFVGNTIAGGTPGTPGFFAAGLSDAALLDQSGGVHVSAGIPFKGRIGGTYLRAAGTGGRPTFRSLEVYGADLSIQPIKLLRVEGEYAQTEWRNTANQGTGNLRQMDRTAADGKVILRPFSKLEVAGQYQRVGIAYDAPGYWFKIGRWFNPKGIEGYGGTLTYPFSRRLSLVGEGHVYQIIGARDNEILHYKAGIRYGLTSSNNVDLGAEAVDWEPAGTGARKNRERYYNVGFGHDFNPNMSFKVLYQYITYDAGQFAFVGPNFNYNGGVAVTQFTVRF